MPEATAHDWLSPKLVALVASAADAGIARDVSVAVITDLINGPLFAAAPVTSADETWNQDAGEPDYMVNPNAPASAEPLATDPVQDPLGGLGIRGNRI